MNRPRIALLYGGKSGEHEVSIASARSVADAIDPQKYELIRVYISKEGEWSVDGKPFSPWDLPKISDFVLPILHGPNGEDGTVQGLLELLNIPYGGCGVVGCAAAMDKIVAKEIFASVGLAQSPYVAALKSELKDEAKGAKKRAEIREKLRLPLFVKPANMGSSVGITKVNAWEDLDAALALACRYDERLVIEQGIDARELEIAVMGNDELICGEIGEIVPGAEFYDYDAKYNNENSLLRIPAPLSQQEHDELARMAQTAYKALGCCGFARCDFLMDKESHTIYINEINAIPGFTNISMFPKLMMAAGSTYPEIVEKILELGYERYYAKNHR